MSLIGADPELFLVKGEKTIIPIGKLGGTKGDPIDLGDGIGVQEDNIMAEFNIPPCEDPYTFADVVTTAVHKVRDHVRKSLKDNKIMISKENEVIVPRDELAVYPQALEFGCSEEFSGYDRGGMVARVSPDRFTATKDADYRFAGGHVHLGYNNPGEVPEFVIACLADLFIGLPSLHYDKQTHRRALYGQAGRFRPTSYGIEYRTMSNWWVHDLDSAVRVGHWSKALMNCIEHHTPDVIRGLFKAAPWRDVERAINTGDDKLAGRLMDTIRRGPGRGLVEY